MKRLALQIVLSLGLALILAWAGSSVAAERLTIAQLQNYHKSYDMHSVTLVGKVQAMQAFEPLTESLGRCRKLYGRAKFVLVDDTGSLDVESLGSCFKAAMNLPHDGDQVEVTVKIQVDIPQGQKEEVMKAIIQEMVVLK